MHASSFLKVVLFRTFKGIIMGKAPCCDKANVKRGPWSPDEDHKLKDFIQKHGTGGNWIALPRKAGLKRCGKSCRLRWLNYLRPNLKHGEFSEDEDRVIFSLFATIGSRWSIIASQLPGRTDNDIKNHWNTKLKKRLLSSCSLPRKKTPLFQQQSLEKQQQQQQQSLSLSPLQLNYLTTASSPYQKPLTPPCFSPQVASESFSPPSSSSSLMQNPYCPAEKGNGNYSNALLYNGHQHSLCSGDYSVHGNVYGGLQEFGGDGFQSAEMGEYSSVYSCEENNNSFMQLRYSLQDQTVVKTVILYELSS